MYCRNCGVTISESATRCSACDTTNGECPECFDNHFINPKNLTDCIGCDSNCAKNKW